MGPPLDFADILNLGFNQLILLVFIGLYYGYWKLSNRISKLAHDPSLILKSRIQKTRRYIFFKKKSDSDSFLISIGFKMPEKRPHELVMLGTMFGIIAAFLSNPVQVSFSGGYLKYIYIIIPVLVAPLIEELFFRGVAYDALRSITKFIREKTDQVTEETVFGIFYFILIPSLFAKLHPSPATKLMPALIYAALYYSSKSIVPSWIAHIIFNANIVYHQIFIQN